MKTQFKLMSFIICMLSLALLSNCSKGSSCDRNTTTTLVDKELCYTGKGVNYTSTKLPDGNTLEVLRLEFIDITGLNFNIELSTRSFNSPGKFTQEFTTGVNYFDDYAYPTFTNSVVVNKPGSFIFTKFDRVNRKASGTFDFNYVINTNQGNVDRNQAGEFTDVSF